MVFTRVYICMVVVTATDWQEIRAHKLADAATITYIFSVVPSQSLLSLESPLSFLSSKSLCARLSFLTQGSRHSWQPSWTCHPLHTMNTFIRPFARQILVSTAGLQASSILESGPENCQTVFSTIFFNKTFGAVHCDTISLRTNIS